MRFPIKASVFFKLAINVTGMGHLPLESSPPIHSKSAIDSDGALMEFLESLAPLDSDFAPGKSRWSAFDVGQEEAYPYSNRPSPVDSPPPSKKARLNEGSILLYETVLDPWTIDQSTLWIPDDVGGRLPVTAAIESGRPQYKSVTEAEPRVTGRYSSESQDNSPMEGVHNGHTQDNIKENSRVEPVNILKEVIQLGLRTARIRLALVDPYYCQLKELMNTSYSGRFGVTKTLVQQSSDLPIGTYKCRTGLGDKNYVLVNQIQDEKKGPISNKRATQSLLTLIRWFFYSHSQLLKHLNFNAGEETNAHEEACSWFFLRLFGPRDGAKVFKKVIGDDRTLNFDFDEVQSRIIRFVAEIHPEKEAPEVSIFLLACWYDEKAPAWNERLHEDGDFVTLLRGLLAKKEYKSKKEPRENIFKTSLKQIRTLKSTFDNPVDLKALKFPRGILRHFPSVSTINRTVAPSPIDPVVEHTRKKIENRIYRYFIQIAAKKNHTTLHSMPELQISAIKWTSGNGHVYVALKFLEGGDAEKINAKLIVNNLNMIIAVARYMHPRT